LEDKLTKSVGRCEELAMELEVEVEAHEETQEMTRQMMKQWADDMQSYKEQTLS
jgi:hypothetical protein